MRVFPKLDAYDWSFLCMGASILIIPALIGGCIGGCMANSETNVSHGELRDYASATSNRIERIEFALSLLSIPVQPKEPIHE